MWLLYMDCRVITLVVLWSINRGARLVAEGTLRWSRWKSGWEKLTWALQPAGGLETRGCSPTTEGGAPFQIISVRDEKERESGVIPQFPMWIPRWMAVLFFEMENTRGAGWRRVSDEFSVVRLNCLCCWGVVQVRSTTRCTRLELEREVCLWEKDERVISMRSVTEGTIVENVPWGV